MSDYSRKDVARGRSFPKTRVAVVHFDTKEAAQKAVKREFVFLGQDRVRIIQVG